MAGTVTVFVVSPDTRSERKYDLHLTVKQLKAKLESVTGIPSDSQLIQLFNSEDESNSPAASPVGVLDDENRALGYYGLRDWQVLKVADTSPPGASLTGQFTDVTQVEKFEISEDDYAKRPDTVLAYKQRLGLGRFAQETESQISSVHTPPTTSAQVQDVQVGQRCEVEPTDEGGLKRRGVVRFVGPTEFANKLGLWVGVQYDEPVGKNDGSVNGKRYFSCPAPFGGFVRPERVRVGDFPPLDLDEELEEM